MRLWDNGASTNALKVRLLLDELGIDCERIDVPLDEVKPEGYAHPFGMVPLLEDDGLLVSESNTILRYLAEKYDRPDLRGTTPAERARIDVLLDSLSLELRPWFLEVEELTVYGGTGGELAPRVAKLEAQLTAYEQLLDPVGPWATGAGFTIADCAIGGRAHHLPQLPLDPACAPRMRRVLARLGER